MNTVPANPFKFGDPVEGSYFLPRPDLTNLVAQFLENRIHVVLIGPRRFGKTSFVLDLLKSLEGRGRSCIFVDIFNITSHRDFLQQMLRALPVQKGWKAMMKRWITAIPKIRPKVSAEIDPDTGLPVLGLALDQASAKDVKEMIQDLLAGLDKLGKKVVVAIDEFQKVAEIEDDAWLEGTLRTHMQRLKHTAFLFTGSQRSIIYDMLNNRARPFYRSCQSIEFPVFGPELTDWVVEKFMARGIECSPKAIEHLRSLVQDTPHYVQMVCFHLFTKAPKRITIPDVEKTVLAVARQNAYAYQTLMHTLTLPQQRALRLVAGEGRVTYTKELLAKYEIPSGAALASALHALKEKAILNQEETAKGAVSFDDPLFATWLGTTP